MARAVRTPAPQGRKTGGQKAPSRAKAHKPGSRFEEDDPYRDLRAPEDDAFEAPADDYIWPEFEDEDEDRI